MRYVNEDDNYNKKVALTRALETQTGLTGFIYTCKKVKKTYMPPEINASVCETHQNTAGLLKKEIMQPNAVVIYLIKNNHESKIEKQSSIYLSDYFFAVKRK